MAGEELFFLGSVTKIHGFKGEVVIRPDTENLEFLNNIESVLLKREGGLVPFFTEHTTAMPNGSIRLKLEGIDTEEAARKLVGTELYLEEDPIPEDAFFLRDLIGWKVSGADGIPMGTIREVNSQTAQPFLVVDYRGKEALLPFHEDLILLLSPEEQHLSLNLPDGLLELYGG